MPGKSFSRRSFLKTSGLALGAATAVGSVPTMQSLALDLDTAEKAGEGEQVLHGVCRGNCHGYCPLNVHVRDGKVVKTSRYEFGDNYFSRICVRGLTHPHRIYHPKRLKYPLRRVGERGAGEWERIGWDEAIDDIAQKMASFAAEFGDAANSFFQGTGNQSAFNGGNPGFTNRLMNVMNATPIDICVDMATSVALDNMVGHLDLWPASSPRGFIGNSKVIFFWAANLTDADPHDWHVYRDAQEAGSKVIVIDPNFTQLASHADLWVPIRPATDAALVLSMCQVIIEEGLVDEDYLRKHTCAPFLVRRDNGRFLRCEDAGIQTENTAINENVVLGIAAARGVSDSPYVVWDASMNAGVELAEAQNPALEGTYTVNDIECDTAYSLLKANCAEYEPEEASKICEVDPDTIRDLAHYACQTPVAHREGYGSGAYSNGVHASYARIVLCALTGNFGYLGTSNGSLWSAFHGTNPDFGAPTGATTAKNVTHMQLREVMRTGKFLGEDYPIKSMWIYQNNPVGTAVQAPEFIEDVLKRLELVVVVDSFLTDTAAYADYVLPCAQPFEMEDIVNTSTYYHIQYADKVMDPPYEAKSDSQIIRLLAGKLGYGEYFNKSDEDYLREVLDTDMAREQGITYEALREKKIMPWVPDDYVCWEDNKFLTPSGRVEFYIEDPKQRTDQGNEVDVERERLPRYFPPAEAYPESPLHDTYPFVLTSVRWRYLVHTMWSENPVLRELDPEPTVRINPADAEPRNIHDGDYVECFNDRGHAVARAVLSEGVRPGVLVYPRAYQIRQHKAGYWSQLTSSAYDPVSGNQNFMDVLCDVRLWDGKED